MAARFFERTGHATLYAKYRPAIPPALIDVMKGYVREQFCGELRQAVDVGCGSGQGTRLLAAHFDRVLGTDVSPAQVAEAAAANTADNITYSVSPAERTPLPADSCQLVMAVQACHWFDLATFYSEADRLLCPSGALALVGYRLPVPVFSGVEDHEAQNLLKDSYVNGLADWIRPESVQTYIDGYTDARFLSPLTDHRRDETTFCDVEGTVGDLLGYCSTWSGFQRMVADRGEDAGTVYLRQLHDRLMCLLGPGITVDTPVVLRFRYFALLSRKRPTT